MHIRKLNNKDWQIIEDRIENRLSGWKGKMVSIGGRLVLINSVLSSLPMFMMSFFKLSRAVVKKLTVSDQDSIGRIINTNANID